MRFFENSIGFLHRTNQFSVFFGNRVCDFSQINKLFPNTQFLKIKQTHSDIVINNNISNPLTEADAHYCKDRNSALLISTADCLPIMIYCRQTHRVAAVHAGWRGVANQILFKTLNTLIETGSTKNNFEIFIGPHLTQNNFEVDEDVFLQLKKSQFKLNDSDYSIYKNNKFYVSLEKIINSQISEATKKMNLSSVVLNFDTKTDERFHSFRRDKAAGRNLSFICLL